MIDSRVEVWGTMGHNDIDGQSTAPTNFLQNFELSLGYDFTQLQLGDNLVQGSGFQLGFGHSFKLSERNRLGFRGNFSRHALAGSLMREANFYRANVQATYQFVPAPRYFSAGVFFALGAGILESGNLNFPNHLEPVPIKTSSSVELNLGVQLKFFEGAIELSYGYHRYPSLDFSTNALPPVAANASGHSVTVGVDLFKVAHWISGGERKKRLRVEVASADTQAPRLRANPIPDVSQREIVESYFNAKFEDAYTGDRAEERKRLIASTIVDPLVKAREAGTQATISLSSLSDSLLKDTGGDPDFLFKVYTVLIDPETQKLFGAIDKKELTDLQGRYKQYLSKQDLQARFAYFRGDFQDKSRKFNPEDVLTLFGIFGGELSEQDSKMIRDFYSSLSKKSQVQEAIICEKALATYLDDRKDLRQLIATIQGARAEQSQLSFENQAFKAISPATLLGKEQKKFPKLSAFITTVGGFLKQEKTEEQVKQDLAAWQKSTEFKRADAKKFYEKLLVTIGIFDGLDQYRDKVDRLLNHLLKAESTVAYISEGTVMKEAGDKSEPIKMILPILKNRKLSYAELKKMDSASGMNDLAMMAVLYANVRRGGIQAVGASREDMEKKLLKTILTFLELGVELDADPKSTYRFTAKEALFWSYVVQATRDGEKYPAQPYLQKMLDALGATGDGDKVFKKYLPDGLVKYRVR